MEIFVKFKVTSGSVSGRQDVDSWAGVRLRLLDDGEPRDGGREVLGPHAARPQAEGGGYGLLTSLHHVQT